jgi:hypothetical protein
VPDTVGEIEQRLDVLRRDRPQRDHLAARIVFLQCVGIAAQVLVRLHHLAKFARRHHRIRAVANKRVERMLYGA